MLQSTSISKSFFPLKDFIAYFYKWIFVILRGQPSSLAWKERICHSMYNTPKSESAELDGKYLLSSWKCRTDAGIINRTLPTCSSCPGWSCMPLGLQVMLFILFRNKYAFGKKQEFSTFRRRYWSFFLLFILIRWWIDFIPDAGSFKVLIFNQEGTLEITHGTDNKQMQKQNGFYLQRFLFQNSSLMILIYTPSWESLIKMALEN